MRDACIVPISSDFAVEYLYQSSYESIFNLDLRHILGHGLDPVGPCGRSKQEKWAAAYRERHDIKGRMSTVVQVTSTFPGPLTTSRNAPQSQTESSGGYRDHKEQIVASLQKGV